MVRIEYERKLTRCETCTFFGHVHDQCLENIMDTPTPIVEKSNDGFQMVVNKKKNDKAGSNIGVKFSGQSVKSNVKYMPKASSGISKTVTSKKNQPSKASESPLSSSGSQNGKNGDPYAKENVASPYDSSNILVSNPYACLNEDSREEVENVFDEYANLLSSAKFRESSSPRANEGCQYKIIGKLLANRLSILIGDCISPVQSTFIKGRYILDGPLILNEVLAWYRQRKKELMVFKVDFEKAFDSLRWDFLDVILDKLGFGSKWRA
nr:RNA-directed DNA polymerase, eukaryota, reverse transcriptase zinc-binding domain protein [Tanacetum cinerariifolium]